MQEVINKFKKGVTITFYNLKQKRGNNELKLFEDKKIRAKWNDEQEKWYFSVVDIVAVLTDNDYQAGRKYWSVLKTRLKKEGNELTTNCSQLKMKSVDGKYYNTDVMTTEQILRLIQSIPSKKAEPFKLCLAQVGKERIERTIRKKDRKKSCI